MTTPEVVEDCNHAVCPGTLIIGTGVRRGTYKCECACHVIAGKVVCPLDGAYCDYCEEGECESAEAEAETD